MGDDLSKTDMSQWHEIRALRKYAPQFAPSWVKRTTIKLISGHPGVGRAYWRCWVAENWKSLDEKGYGPTEEILAVAILEGE